MSENADSDPDHFGDGWMRKWEEQCRQDWEDESNMEDIIQRENEREAQRLWMSFQNCATAIAQLYKDGSNQNAVSVWIPFQNAASSVSLMYRDSLDTMRRSYDMGSQSGYLRRTRDILSWAKKRRHHIRREDLVAFLCGKAPPARHRGASSLGRSASRVSVDRSSPRLPPATEPMEDQAEPDLQPFRDALALQGLSGAMSNVSVRHNSSASGGVDYEQSNVNELHCFIMDEMSRRSEPRKRTSSNGDVIMDSPSRKRSRLF
ncbi:hypothetical protein LSAT2_000099 [Lamellibrachia satsuma]|nr:hypothetical protein LSAT2_000099 [Lamellibrachia satsuma]